jgi:hypothetical protein
MSTNVSEEIVLRFFRRSFLSLWSYGNPQGKNAGKELCDTLVVCDPDLVIVSVKASDLVDVGGANINEARWRKRTIDESVPQIYGAERWLSKATHVIRSDGTPGLPLPSLPRIHRVAVAAGGRRRVYLRSADFGKGFVHVFDETSLAAVISECDTVTDFIAYLSAKETLYGKGVEIIFDSGGEEDLLALYVHRGRQFPPEMKGRVLLPGTNWVDFTAKDEYRAKKAADRVSYVWDGLVDHVATQALAGDLEFGSSLTETEVGLRTMAREDRFSRRLLADAWMEFLDPAKKVESRLFVSPSGVAYVFLALPYGTDRAFRRATLSNRCFVARSKIEGLGNVVVGIATERRNTGQPPGFSLDLCFLRKEDWTAEDQRFIYGMQKDLGYFVEPRITESHVDEYPGVCPDQRR